MNIQRFLLTLLVLTSVNAFACECSYIKSIEKEFENADYVLTGKIISIEFLQILKADGKKTTIQTSKIRDKLDIFKGRVWSKITLEIIEIFKGKRRKKNQVIYTGSGGGDCSFYFEKGEEYLIYAFKDTWATNELKENSRKHKTFYIQILAQGLKK
ncbi:hypothetical protein M4I21_17705 [Cellulophaga sp. 20_2_10]|uniref:hypothetical protein n=1 Tax=Cellulophaga sp. 20_2_10 TaxID=2942476 RepID=UPI00201B18B9|nr:hypothetical protein [Cellulophaga sp. 20_2_10]MCL5247657.1 hypothetical protein [Cellulophaga sp. 20_2_10]